MAKVNNNGSIKSNMREPTIADLFELMQHGASKDDMEEIKLKIDASTAATDSKIEEIKVQVSENKRQNDQNSDKIMDLQASIELLKQEQLKTNICISGIPPELITNDNVADLVLQISNKLGVESNKNQFSAYPVNNKKFVIVRFFNLKNKQQLLGKIRIKKSLMVEEVFNVASNSQIYLNDHLTPYFNRLYLLARNAKKDGKIASASSYGGKIRARKYIDDLPILITTEYQLQTLIETEDTNNSFESQQHVDNMMDLSHSTSHQSHTNTTNSTRSTSTLTSSTTKPKKNNKPSGVRLPARKRRQEEKEETEKAKKQRESENAPQP